MCIQRRRVCVNKPILSIVVPCYNEAATLERFVEAIQALAKDLPQVKLEMLFVNDGSRDETLALMRRLQQDYPDHIHYLSFSRNFGKEAAMLAGLQAAQGNYVALMDADLQDPPELLVEMYRLIQQEGYDMVGTKRSNRRGEPRVRSFFADAFYRLNNLITNVPLEPGVRDYRLMKREVVDAVLRLAEHNRFSKGIFAWVGFNTTYLDYPNIERVAGQSSWSFWQLFDYALEGLVNFSEVPLTIVTLMGVLIFVLALIYGIFIVVRTLLMGSTTPGWPSLVVFITGMGGLQLLGLGILGKYIAKIFTETKQRPHYIIQESSDIPTSETSSAQSSPQDTPH